MYIFLFLSLNTLQVHAFESTEDKGPSLNCEQTQNSAFESLQKLNTAIICNKNFSTRWSHKKEAKEWTKSLCESLANEGANLFKTKIKDIKSFCPNYGNLNSVQEKMQFWILLLTEIAGFETNNFNPHDKGDQKYFGDSNASIGLFQMSRGDNCPQIKTNQDLTNASKNINCAVYKFNQLIAKDHVIADQEKEGAARYWGPLREPKGPVVDESKLSGNEKIRYNCVNKKCVSKREQIKRITRKLNVCQT